MDTSTGRSTRDDVIMFDIIPTLDQVDDYDVAAIADDVIGQYFSATGTPHYVVAVNEDAYWAAVERHAIAH
nr:MAG TPA: Tetrahydromethanopterin S-methyltransferase subunit B [Caudoviricetes sp.]